VLVVVHRLYCGGQRLAGDLTAERALEMGADRRSPVEVPVQSLDLAILRRAELGFLGVAVLTAVHTPLFCGEDRSLDFFLKELKLFCRAGAVDFLTEV